MRTTTFRKVGLGSCMFLALASGMPLGTPAARANTQLPISTTGLTNTATSAVTNSITNTATSALNSASGTSFFSGQATSAITGIMNGTTSIQSAATQLAANAVSGVTASTMQTALTNIMSGTNINPQSAIGLLGGMMSGNISSALGTALSGIPNLGNITSVAGLTSALNSVTGAINSGLTGAVGSAAQQALQAAGLSSALSAITGQAGAGILSNPAVAAAVSQNFPGLASALGGTAGVQAALTQLGQQIAGQVGGIVGGLIGGLLGSGSALAGAATGSGSTSVNLGCAIPGGCCATCGQQIPQHYQEVRDHVDTEFLTQQSWFLRNYWKENILPALMLMAEQLTVAGVQQIEMVGALLDAKHQLETQRVFQELTAQAHKDYQPSEGMCTFGTTVMSLAASERKSDISQVAFAQRMTQRQAMSGEVVSKQSRSADIRSRLQTFITTYCDQADNGNGLSKLCPNPVPTASRRNIDVDYTRNIESRLTLDLDFAPSGTGATAGGTPTPDAQDVFALSANLYSDKIAPPVPATLLGDGKGNVRMSAAEKYMELRSIFAKRSVAQNSFAAITAMRAAGDDLSAPYTKALIKELGVTDTADIEKFLGKKPSYFAQMEVLTKKLYQNPTFYTELYDKPANVERKGAALQAIGLMQDRDLYNSLLRSEAVLSVLLETMLQKEQQKIVNTKGSGGEQ